MITISLCMIVKDEEDVLERCLESIRDCVEEIVIVDTGSTDRTWEIASRYTTHVYSFPWRDDFAAARNFSFSKATMQYTMWLDADDVILPKDREKLSRLKQTLNPSVDVVMMQYHTAFDEKGEPTYSYYRERLVKTALHLQWEGEIHEVITPCGNVVYADVAVAHKKLSVKDPDRNLRIFENLLSQGKTLDPRQQFYYARELYYHEKYKESLAVLENYLGSGQGWIENRIEACKQTAECLYALGEEEKALDALFYSFRMDSPRAEICCMIGAHFYQKQQYETAIFWYELALQRPRRDESGGFIHPDCYDFIPYMQLCVCYDKLGQHAVARMYNEKAGRCKPDDPSYQYNRSYFARILGENSRSIQQ